MAESNKQINESENAKLFRSRMEIFVLNALDEKDGHGYGYDVISYIQEHTKGHYKIKSISTIYNILKRLETAGFVYSSKGDGESYGAARVYYTLTEAGKAYLEQDKKEWKYIRTLLDNLVSDEDFDLDNDEPPYSASVLKPLTRRQRDNGSSDTEEDDSSHVHVATEDSTTGSAAVSFNPSSDDFDPDQADTEVYFENVDDDVPFYNYSDEAESVSPVQQPQQPPQSQPSVTPEPIDAVAASSLPDAGAAVVNPPHSDTPETPYNPPVQPETQPSERLRHLHQAQTALFGAPLSEMPDVDGSGEGFRPLVFDRSTSSGSDFHSSEVLSAHESIQETMVRTEEQAPTIPAMESNDDAAHSLLSPYIKKLKNDLQSEGYTLNTFSPSQKANTIKYLLVNKIFRDSVIASFFYLVITLLVTYLFKNTFEIPLTTLLIVGGVGLLPVFISTIVCLRDSKKKKKDAFEPKLLISILTLISLVVFMGFTVYYLFTSKYNLTSPQLYGPAIILSTIPFFGIIYTILHGSGKYSQ